MPSFRVSAHPLLGAIATATVLLVGLSAKPATAQELSVMSYNLRLDTPNDGQDAWPNRREALAAQIGFLAPDVLGVQEALPQQMDYLRERLDGYDYVGVGRRAADGDEFSAIFYRRGRFEALASSTFWLSPTPDTVSNAWGANLPRIATWARFREIGSDREFVMINTHLDHQSGEAREKGLALIATVADSLAAPGTPVILTGDFNATPESAALTQLRDRYVDAAEVVEGPRLGPTGTFSGFDASTAPERRIDYILLRRGPRVTVDAFATLNPQSGGRYLSDHHAVMARLHLRPAPIVIGHRGARGHATENSLAGIQAALDMGVDMIEIDVFRIADGEIVVFHDPGLARLTDGEGKIEELTLAEVNQLTLDGAHKIPRLRDVLALMDHRARLNVELKGANTAEGTHAILEEFVAERGYKWEDFAISSFRHGELRRMRELHPGIDIGILPTGGTEASIAVGREVNARSINPNHSKLSAEDVAAMHAAGFLIFPWTVNAPEDIARVTALGVDGIITDYPDRVGK